jgi:hypothetical protein
VPNTIALTAPFQPIMRHDKQPLVTHEIEIPDYTESREFKSYVRDVERVIRRSGKRGASTAAIHAALGTEHRAWTLDAVFHIADVMESTTILPTRYSIQTEKRTRTPFRYGAVVELKG